MAATLYNWFLNITDKAKLFWNQSITIWYQRIISRFHWAANNTSVCISESSDLQFESLLQTDSWADRQTTWLGANWQFWQQASLASLHRQTAPDTEHHKQQTRRRTDDNSLLQTRNNVPHKSKIRDARTCQSQPGIWQVLWV